MCTSGLGFHGISVNSSVMDEGAPVQKDSPTISNLNCVLSIGQHIHAKEILGVSDHINDLNSNPCSVVKKAYIKLYSYSNIHPVELEYKPCGMSTRLPGFSREGSFCTMRDLLRSFFTSTWIMFNPKSKLGTRIRFELIPHVRK